MKKLLSLLLCVLLLLPCGVLGGVGAAESRKAVFAEKDAEPLPFLLIRGMQFTGLTYKAGTDEERNAFGGINALDLVQTLGKAVAGGLMHRDINVFTDTLVDYADDLLGLMACDANGQSKYDVSVESYDHAVSQYPELWGAISSGVRELGILKRAVEEYGADNVYYYNYDWRLDPFMHAEKIEALIQTALRETGKSQINLCCASMGGILTMAYLSKYGPDKLHRVLFLSSTFFGTYVTGDVLRGEVRFTGESLYNFLQAMVGSENKGLSILFRVMNAMRVFRLVDYLAEYLVPRIKDRVYDTFLRDTFGTMPTVWALVQPGLCDDCIDYMFSGREKEYAGIIRLAKQYKEMNAARTKMLRKCMKRGLEVCVVANYDLPVVPAYAHSNAQGDTVLESKWMLGGAKVAEFGKTLPDNYAPKTPGRLSADRMVDLSTVFLPESTWAIKGAPHVSSDYGTDYSEFVFWLMRAKKQPTVSDSPQYPQFMRSSFQQELIPLK